MERTREERYDAGKREKEWKEIYRKMKGGRPKSGTNQQRKQERKQREGRRDWVRQREISGRSSDDIYRSHVGADPFIALPTKADNGTKTQWTERGLYGPICVCVYMCVCSGSLVKGP